MSLIEPQGRQEAGVEKTDWQELVKWFVFVLFF